MGIDRIYSLFGSGFRRQRMFMFTQLFAVTERTNVLDMGGNAADWDLSEPKPRLTLLNLDVRCLSGHAASTVADALAVPFDDGTFDVVHSNSLIEHLGSERRQRAFASEVRRLSRKGYFIQTPNKWFPIEPHYIAPFVQFVPKWIRPTVVRWMTPRGWLTSPSRQQCTSSCQEIRLLDAREMKRMFPEAAIIRERFLGLTKSLIAVWQASGTIGNR